MFFSFHSFLNYSHYSQVYITVILNFIFCSIHPITFLRIQKVYSKSVTIRALKSLFENYRFCAICLVLKVTERDKPKATTRMALNSPVGFQQTALSCLKSPQGILCLLNNDGYLEREVTFPKIQEIDKLK